MALNRGRTAIPRHRPHVRPLRDAPEPWPRIHRVATKDPCGSKLPQRRPHSHGPRRRCEHGIDRGLPLNVARISPTRRRPTRRAEAPRVEIGNVAKPLCASEEPRAGLSRGHHGLGLDPLTCSVMERRSVYLICSHLSRGCWPLGKRGNASPTGQQRPRSFRGGSDEKCRKIDYGILIIRNAALLSGAFAQRSAPAGPRCSV